MRSFRFVALLVVACAARGLAQESPVARRIDRALLERTARRAEPDLQGRPERLSQYLDAFQRDLTDDRRLVLCDVVADPQGDDGVLLAGVVELPETRAALAEFFSLLNFAHVDNQIELLPAAELGDKRLGFVIKPHALVLEAPESSATVGTDCVFGEPVFLLRQVGDYLHIHGSDGYLGYISADAVHRVTEAELARYLDGPVAVLRADYEEAEGATLPAGVRLKWIRSTAGGIVVEQPTGAEMSLPNAITQVRQQSQSLVANVVSSAERLLGTPYLWGGKTSGGVDCSGLVQVAFAAGGVSVPRDANQQFHVGRLTGTRWCTAAMRRGDTLYFVGAEGRVRHTGIYLGDGRYIHAGSPVVMVNSLRPADDKYDARRAAAFAFARRLWD